MFDKDLIIFDVETSSVNPQTGSILQIGAIRYSKKGYLTEDTFSCYVKPYKPEWTDGAFAVHKLTKQFLEENGKDIKDAIFYFDEWITGAGIYSFDESRLAFWNSTGFDYLFLKNAHTFIKREFYFNRRCVDISSFVRIYTEIMYGLGKNASMGSCASRLKVKTNKVNLHDALYDATIEGKMFAKIVDGITRFKTVKTMLGG